MMGGEASGS
jgi:hypothetical protein